MFHHCVNILNGGLFSFQGGQHLWTGDVKGTKRGRACMKGSPSTRAVEFCHFSTFLWAINVWNCPWWWLNLLRLSGQQLDMTMEWMKPPKWDFNDGRHVGHAGFLDGKFPRHFWDWRAWTEHRSGFLGMLWSWQCALNSSVAQTKELFLRKLDFCDSRLSCQP